MKIRALPVVYHAVQQGVEAGLLQVLQESKKPENAGNPDLMKEIISATVMQCLVNAIDFGDELKALTTPNEQ